jgi:YggT family protein
MPYPFLPIFLWITYYVIYYGFPALIIAILIRVVASWINIDERVAFIRFLARITDPFIVPCRRIIGRVGVLDLSYLVASFLLITLRILLLQSLPMWWV